MSNTYLCCGVPANPWNDIFGNENGATIPNSQEQGKSQDWDNPFGVAPPQFAQAQRGPSADSRSVGSYGTRSAGTYGDARSVDSSAGQNSMLSNKSLKDIEREQAARRRALALSENLINTGQIGQVTMGDRPTTKMGRTTMTAEMTQKLAGSSLIKQGPTPMDEKILASKAALIEAKRAQDQVRRTETTLPKKELTPEDVRDPETVPGMRERAEVDKEVAAKRKAVVMISNGKYRYHEKAGIALYTMADALRPRKTDGTLNPIC